MDPLHVLGVRVDRLGRQEVARLLNDMLHDGRGHQVVTVNPEFVTLAQRRPIFKSILCRADLAVADGVGLIFASRILGQPIKSRLTGLDLIDILLDKAEKLQLSVGIIGSQPGVPPKAAAAMVKEHKNLRIAIADTEQRSVGWHIKESLFVSRVRRAAPDILFVALGAPKQEEWIFHHLHELPSVRIAVGVGGAIDYWAGHVRRAPAWMRSIGLEWLFRLIQEPWRFIRIIDATVVFPWLILFRRRHRES